MTTNTIQVLRSYICKRPPRHVIPTEVLVAEVGSSEFIETEDDDEQSLDEVPQLDDQGAAEQFLEEGSLESELGGHRGENEAHMYGENLVVYGVEISY